MTMIFRTVQTLLGLLFVTAGVIKTQDFGRFAETVFNFQLLPWAVSAAMAFFLPWIEIAAGIAILLRKGERGALMIALGLGLVFFVALASAWGRGLDISCGCFGGTGKTNYPLALGIDAAIVWAGAVLLRVRLLESAGRDAQPRGQDAHPTRDI